MRWILATPQRLCVAALCLAATPSIGAESPPPMGKTWDELIANLPCDRVAKSGDDKLLVTGTTILDGERRDDRKITDQKAVEDIKRKCCGPNMLPLMGVGKGPSPFCKGI